MKVYVVAWRDGPAEVYAGIAEAVERYHERKRPQWERNYVLLHGRVMEATQAGREHPPTLARWSDAALGRA